MKLINQNYCLEDQGGVCTRPQGDIIIYIKSKAYSLSFFFFFELNNVLQIKYVTYSWNQGCHLFLGVLSLSGFGFKFRALGSS